MNSDASRLLLSKLVTSACLIVEFVFTGSEGFTCHQFIRAIREQALNAGKQRDNQWMLDYASVRFDGEALEWFEALEDEIQNDWTLLRRAILARYSVSPGGESVNRPQGLQETRNSPVFTFTGKDKDECAAFVREIRLKAFADGKEADPDWMRNAK
ncbi:hypothetical protein FRC04_007828 [Tulasnella sp. 424]|nr:hypothetical protein FRC04_007828 [Tulasnella sp. 424]